PQLEQQVAGVARPLYGERIHHAPALGRQAHEDAARVLWVGLLGHPSLAVQAIDRLGHGRETDLLSLGELAHTLRAALVELSNHRALDDAELDTTHPPQEVGEIADPGMEAG